MGAARPGRRELEHLRAQRRDHDRHLLGGLRPDVERLLHGVEVGGHGRDGLLVLVAAHAGDEMGVGDAEAERDAPGRELAEGLLDRAHRHRVAGVDVGDAGAEADALGARRQPGDQREGVAPDRLGEPERPVAPAPRCFAVNSAASPAGRPSSQVHTPSLPKSMGAPFPPSGSRGYQRGVRAARRRGRRARRGTLPAASAPEALEKVMPARFALGLARDRPRRRARLRRPSRPGRARARAPRPRSTTRASLRRTPTPTTG